MNDWSTWLQGALYTLPLAGVVTWWLWRGGYLRRDAMASGPSRDVAVSLLDLGLAVLLMLAGGLAAQALLAGVMASRPGEAGQGGAASAWAALVVQALSLGPAALVLVGRAMQAEAGLRRSGLVPRWPGRDAAWGVLSLVAAIPLATAVSLVVSGLSLALGIETPMIGHEVLQRMRDEASARALALMIVSAVVVAPVLEECVFRGLLQTAMLRVWGEARRWWIVLASSVIFAGIHASVGAWQALPTLMLLGVVWGYVYERTGSLWPGIVSHAGFNAYNVALALLVMPQA